MTDILQLSQTNSDGTSTDFYPVTQAGAVKDLEKTIDDRVGKVNVGVTSVNKKTGIVTLTASDVGALPANGKAATAGTADKATNADHATKADTATSASSATTAGSATTATTATKLAKPVTINGQSFDGSANITIPIPAAPGLASATANGLMSKADFSKLAAMDGIKVRKVATVDDATGVVTPIK